MNAPVMNLAARLGAKITNVAVKHGPNVLVYAGLGGVVLGTVLACRATWKLKAVLDEDEPKFLKVEEAREAKMTEAGEEYSEEDYKKDFAMVRVQRAVKIAKLYLPAVAVGGLSLASIIWGHRIINQRMAVLMMAYETVQRGWNSYRDNVISELGNDKDDDFRLGKENEEVTSVVEEDGRTLKKTKRIPNTPYTFIFDESTPMYKRNNMLNKWFLTSLQNELNDKLKTEGILFMNEALQAIGLPRTAVGSYAGWVYSKNGGYDDVDLGLGRLFNAAFINGEETTAIIDFNCRANILEYI